MRLPRDLSGDDLAGLLHRHYGYRLIRQRGSHMTLTATIRGTEHNVTIPRHRQRTDGLLGNRGNITVKGHQVCQYTRNDPALLVFFKARSSAGKADGAIL